MPVEIRVPQLGESIVEATITRWLKKDGDAVTAGETILELDTDKVNVEVPADESGVIQGITGAEGDTVAVGDLLATIVPAAAAPVAAAPVAATAVAAEAPAPVAETHASPVAKRLADSNNVDLSQLKGSGPNGRIVKDDVATFVERQAEAPATATTIAAAASAAAPASKPAPAAPAAAPAAPSGRPEERVRMTRRRQTIATRLVEAQHTAAMLTTFNEIDMTAVMEVRKRRKDSFKEKHGVGLGFMSFFTKATIGALKAFPYVNGEIQGDEIVLKKYYDIGVAVGVEEGLVVPVVRDADRKTFAEIEKEIGSLAGKARENKLTIAEMLGGTFTITNGGVYGSLMSTPILNTPQVGILGMHKIEERPIAVAGQVVIRPMMYVALSYDHRIVDGGTAVRFLVKIKELLEDPESLLLEG
ncbi:dihydrolipoyllysine-residue succinyltransferase component of 2-oxoglutarate dehydrogenase complex [Capsulimonas corticalis]|uniref:Dihydrolipoyllysine-residue succinyltransferase component of 2-oxoglutarate dehydrogenase complex n=1 Tax=Capsulimonas corticalis TaxID=2219043 RepID=A0A402D3Q8_9BACT|nr:2-oxoglutarate dehydrogenase complex dihydrolipoyllysine-residue succinyltransferase [Capsulimonas corticalis]BDI31849.1 dihydrolipoyllysine-residue succinyltransferase component of 2-oxoglutarate dehydrogenase complex [Capsulimonas corticalis]